MPVMWMRQCPNCAITYESDTAPGYEQWTCEGCRATARRGDKYETPAGWISAGLKVVTWSPPMEEERDAIVCSWACFARVLAAITDELNVEANS